MAGPRRRQVTRLMLAAAGFSTLAACGGACEARLTVVNASGLAIVSGALRPPGGRDAVPLGNLPSPGTREHRFQDLSEGAYSVDFRFADGSSRRDTALGYLTRGMRFQDTLFINPSGAPSPFALKQAPAGCREGLRLKTLIRAILKKAF